MYNKEFYNLVEKYDLSVAQAAGFLTAYVALEGNLDHPKYGNLWEVSTSKRSITRVIYEASLTIISGYVTQDALSILDNQLLDKSEKTKLTTHDHVFSPQTYGHFICSRWDLFKGDLDNFFKHMIILSTTVHCSVVENNKFKKFTVNDATTKNILRLKVPTQDRYAAAGIKRLFNKNTGKYAPAFPFELSEDFDEFQKKELLI